MKCILFFILFACASGDRKYQLDQDHRITNQSSINLASFYFLIPFQRQIHQLVTYKKNEQVKTAQVVLNKKIKFRISVLSTLGVELATFEIEPTAVKIIKSLPQIDQAFINTVLGDILLVYSKGEELKLDGPILLNDLKNERVFTENGKKIISIKYFDDRSWKSLVKYENYGYDYQLEIETLSFKKL